MTQEGFTDGCPVAFYAIQNPLKERIDTLIAFFAEAIVLIGKNVRVEKQRQIFVWVNVDEVQASLVLVQAKSL